MRAALISVVVVFLALTGSAHADVDWSEYIDHSSPNRVTQTTTHAPAAKPAKRVAKAKKAKAKRGKKAVKAKARKGKARRK